MKPIEWHGCYTMAHGLWVKDAYAHPAKMAPGLCFRIIEHLEALGLLRPGATILDPMCGIGTTLLCGGLKGYRMIGLELEDKFVRLAEENREYLAGPPRNIGLDITILQGDARHLADILVERDLVAVMSPPYADGLTGGGIAKEGYSTPYQRDKISGQNFDPVGNRTYMAENLGDSPGQIGHLKDNAQEAAEKTMKQIDQIRGVDAKKVVLTSPPYGGHVSEGEGDYHPNRQSGSPAARQYPHSSGQIADEPGSYLDAMRQVYAQCYQVASVIAVVVKDPTRDKKLRLLGDDTRALLRAVGYRILEPEIHAILFEEQEQGHLFDGSKKQVRGRLSFFKRLSYHKGSPVARYEHVIIGVRGDAMEGAVGLMSPPYTKDAEPHRAKPMEEWRGTKAWGGPHSVVRATGYSDNPANIGNLKDGSMGIVVTSPPYEDAMENRPLVKSDEHWEQWWESYRKGGGGMSLDEFKKYQGSFEYNYGQAQGQIGRLRDRQP